MLRIGRKKGPYSRLETLNAATFSTAVVRGLWKAFMVALDAKTPG
jgi:hypothetical protein